jgi:hypothetical protein
MSSTPPSAFPVIRLFDPADGLLATEAGSPSTSAWPQTRECLRYPQKNLAGPQRELESLQIWHPVSRRGASPSCCCYRRRYDASTGQRAIAFNPLSILVHVRAAIPEAKIGLGAASLDGQVLEQRRFLG